MSANRPGEDTADDSEGASRPSRRWRKSSFSMSNGDCIEVATLASNSVGVRDSKAIAGPRLSFSTGVWTAFVGDVRLDRTFCGQ